MAGTFTALLFHVVFSTKDRQPLISEIWSDDLYAYMGGIARSEGGSLRCAGGIEDHVHLLLECKASMPLSTVVGRIKAQSSKWVNENGKASARFDWQRGYSAFSVSAAHATRVRRYIASQREHHAVASFRDELVAFLDDHGVEFEDRFLLG
ncbi:MAG: IS200/IS605 family transposase [Deltaproteobacteria bacterium]|nr:IS200/IS605 family transposase [Deltaproteobacteria bacterium]